MYLIHRQLGQGFVNDEPFLSTQCAGCGFCASASACGFLLAMGFTVIEDILRCGWAPGQLDRDGWREEGVGEEDGKMEMKTRDGWARMLYTVSCYSVPLPRTHVGLLG